MTLEAVRAWRRAEAESDLQFLDLGDCPLRVDPEAVDRLVDVIRSAQPAFMLCHSTWDSYNTDLTYAARKALVVPMIERDRGHRPVRGRKRSTIECVRGQEHSWRYDAGVATNRGNPFRRNSCGQASGLRATHGKGFQSTIPREVDER